MSRLALEYGDHEVEMPRGESFIGRAVGCQLRFNDAAISRRHLRVMCTGDGAFAENLSMTNSTRVNGVRLNAVRQLGNGDTLEIGHRVPSVLVDDSAMYQDSGPVTIDGPLAIGTGLVASESVRNSIDRHGSYDYEDAPVEATRPGGGPLGAVGRAWRRRFSQLSEVQGGRAACRVDLPGMRLPAGPHCNSKQMSAASPPKL
ncbi:MAG: FHA domain-containing protein [Myxococcales bacterium]|nr:FHA domain-containing protein [Myxococcales bacterium]